MSMMNLIASILIVDRIGKISLPEFPEFPKQMLTKEKMDNRYAVIIHDLSKASEDKEYDLNHIKYSSMTLIYADSNFTFKINSSGNKACPVKAKQAFTLKLEIEKVYISNKAAAGTAILFLTRMVD